MANHDASRPEAKPRRWLMRLWIGATVVLALYVALASVAVWVDPRNAVYAALPIPPVMFAIVVLAAGGWLVWLVSARRR